MSFFNSYLLLVSLLTSVLALRTMDVAYQWRSLEFDFPSLSYKKKLIQDGRFIPGTIIPLDVDKAADSDNVYVTVPRLVPGVPSTLNTIVDNPDGGSPLLRPFPGWEWNLEGYCDALTSVFRVQTDRCGRLWVPDTGIVDTLNTFQRICPAQLVAFTHKGSTVLRHRFDPSLIKPTTLLVSIAVDIPDGRKGCRNTVVYIADVTGFALLAYNLRYDISWRIESNYFYPYPRWGHFKIAGSELDIMDGVIGLTLGPLFPHGDRVVYFHSLASDSESWVLASILRNPGNFPNGTNLTPQSFKVFSGTRPSQSAAEAMDDNGILFFSHLATNSMHCWNSRFQYSEHNLIEIDQDDEALQFVSGVKVINIRDDEPELWAISSRFQELATGTLNPYAINFRILRAPISKLVHGTNCEILYLKEEETNVTAKQLYGWGV